MKVKTRRPGGIRKRGGNSWELTIDLGRRPDGSRQRHFVSVRGKKSDAERRLRELLQGVDKGLPPNTGKLTVAEYLARWDRDHVQPNTRARTAQRYESDIRLHINPAVGKTRLTQLRAADVQALEAGLLAKGLSPRSVRHVHVVIKEALKHAVRWGFIHANVAEAVVPPRFERKEIQPPGVEEVRRILGVCPRNDVLSDMRH